MCTTCGCQNTEAHSHQPAHQSQSIALEKAILETNDRYADQNRAFLRAKNSVALNFVSSPGSGKTSLLETTIRRLSSKYKIAVIEGDQQTRLDAERIEKAGAKAWQINTGKACHLDAHRVGHAFAHLSIETGSFVFIENVGNLICPSMFDLGEQHRVALISTTEGEDKPLKYPDMFYYADTVVINKIDLLPYLDFNLAVCIQNIHKIRKEARIFEVSVKDGSGVDKWY